MEAMSVEERAVHFPENPEAVGLEELPESQKEKDRDQARGMQGVLGKLRYISVPSAVMDRKLAEAKKLDGAAKPKP